MKTQKAFAGAGLLSAVAASLCCIAPLLALLAGTSGLASSFSWIEPLRPYLIGLSILTLGYAWYQKLKPAKKSSCCATDKPKFIETKTFLGIVTVFSALMLSFPYYSKVFFGNKQKQVAVINPTMVKTASFSIEGMTCAGCEEHVNSEVNKLPGIVKCAASYDKANAVVEYDQSQTNINDIVKAIAETGYSVTKTIEN